MIIRVSQNAPEFTDVSHHKHMAAFIHKKFNTQKIKSFKAIFLDGHHFCVYEGISQKYKENFATGPFLLSFETGWSN
jgi:hypothetical protein